MPSTKYPEDVLIFPYFQPGEQAERPYIIYPNWRGSQRLPLPTNASAEHQRHERLTKNGLAHFPLLDFNLLQFLKDFTIPILVVIEFQSYNGEYIETLVVELFNVYWCGDKGKSIPRLDYRSTEGPERGKDSLVWGPLLLAIAPVREGTSGLLHVVTDTTSDPKPGFVPPLIRILEEYGTPKAL